MRASSISYWRTCSHVSRKLSIETPQNVTRAHEVPDYWVDASIIVNVGFLLVSLAGQEAKVQD